VSQSSLLLFPLPINFLEDFKKCSEVLCCSTLECVVRERYGSKALRIFRLLLLKRLLDQKQVEESAMLSSKEAREILYTLMADNFVSVQVSLTRPVVCSAG